MASMAVGGDGSADDARAGLVERLRARRGELVGAIFARVQDDAFGPVGAADVEYVAGLRAAVGAALDYGLEGIERGEEWAGPIPVAVLEQARRAARIGVSLDTVLRRYVVGHTLFGEFVMEEADRGELPVERSALPGVLRAQAALLDRLLAAITSEYGDEIERAGRSPEQRRSERVRRLLDGGAVERVELAELDYELGGWHVGVIVRGPAHDTRKALRGLADELDRRLLCVECGEGTVWAWLGGQRGFDMAAVERSMSGLEQARPVEVADRAGVREDGRGDSAVVDLPGGDLSAGVSFAVGEPGRGLAGWRLTHRQAQVALLVALRRPRGFTRYADIALLATALKDEALARALIDIYLSPLDDDGHNRGAVLRETLREYFYAGRNASSAAARLNVARNTVENRLRTIEQALDRQLHTCLAELEVALGLEELGVGADGEVASIVSSENHPPAHD